MIWHFGVSFCFYFFYYTKSYSHFIPTQLLNQLFPINHPLPIYTLIHYYLYYLLILTHLYPPITNPLPTYYHSLFPFYYYSTITRSDFLPTIISTLLPPINLTHLLPTLTHYFPLFSLSLLFIFEVFFLNLTVFMKIGLILKKS